AMPHWIEGNTHAIIPAFNPELVLDTLERDRVTHLLLVPTMIQMLVDHPAMKKPRDLSALQTIGYGASPMSEAVLERAMAALRGGWMHTGDGAWMDEDGFIFIADRLKDMIISGGENIYSAETENAVAQHPAVAVCAVIGIPSDEWGETVHAVVVCKPGETVSGDALIAHCKSLIAGYKCPRSVDFTDALPLSGAGKVLKTKLREPFWQGRERNVA